MKSAFLRLFRIIGKYRALLLVSIAGAVGNVVCTLFAPLIVGRAVDRMTDRGMWISRRSAASSPCWYFCTSAGTSSSGC